MGLLHGYNPSEAAVQSSSSVWDCYFRPSDNGKVGVSDEGERARSVTGDLFRMCVCLLEGDRETDAICTQDPAVVNDVSICGLWGDETVDEVAKRTADNQVREPGVAASNTFEAHRREEAGCAEYHPVWAHPVIPPARCSEQLRRMRHRTGPQICPAKDRSGPPSRQHWLESQWPRPVDCRAVTPFG